MLFFHHFVCVPVCIYVWICPCLCVCMCARVQMSSVSECVCAPLYSSIKMITYSPVMRDSNDITSLVYSVILYSYLHFLLWTAIVLYRLNDITSENDFIFYVLISYLSFEHKLASLFMLSFELFSLWTAMPLSGMPSHCEQLFYTSTFHQRMISYFTC